MNLHFDRYHLIPLEYNTFKSKEKKNKNKTRHNTTPTQNYC